MSRATYYRTLRSDPIWCARVDACENSMGVNVDAAAAALWIAERHRAITMQHKGARLTERSERAARFYRQCSACGEDCHVRARVCSLCGETRARAA